MVTQRTTQATALPTEVIAEDKRLDSTYEHSTRTAAHTKFQRDRLRWEWTQCPNGPGLTYAQYGQAVDRGADAIRKSATAYAATKTGTIPVSVADCLYGEVHDPARTQIMPETPDVKPTFDEAEAHADAVHRMSGTERENLIVAAIALLWRQQESTIRKNASWTETKRKCRDAASVVREDDPEAEAKIQRVVGDVYAEYRLDETRAKRIARWMAENRGVEASQIPIAEAREMLESIHRLASRKEISYDEADAERREWDRRSQAAERIKNEQLRAAHRAVIELRKAASEVRGAAARMVKAIRVVEDEGYEVTDDDRSLFLDDIATAMSALQLVQVAFGEESGADWDTALANLTGGAR